MSSTKLEIISSDGTQLNADLELPANKKPDHYAILAYCFECNRNIDAIRNISRSMANHGFGVVRVDSKGHDSLNAIHEEQHFRAIVRDIQDAYSYMTDHYESPRLLVGFGLGGTAAIVAGADLPEVKAIATIGSPSTVGNTTEVLDTVKGLRKTALLIMHSPVDLEVSPDHAHHLFIHAFHPKSFVALDGADHSLSKERDSLYTGNVIGSWAARFMPLKDEKELSIETEQLVAYLNVVEDKFTTSVKMNNHFLTADEPNYVGGNDFGPSPYELLVSSLAACTAMTLKLHAQKNKWDLHEVYVYSNHSKKHLQDVNDEHAGKLDHIYKRLVLIGDLTIEQQQRLLEIAENCPVHKTLESEVVIETSLSSGSDLYT